MLPFILAGIGGYLIGTSTEEVFKEGGLTSDLQDRLNTIRKERDEDFLFPYPTTKNTYILMALNEQGFGYAIGLNPLTKEQAEELKEKTEMGLTEKGMRIKIFTTQEVLDRPTFPEEEKGRINKYLKFHQELHDKLHR